MKIAPTQGEFNALRSASMKLETICKGTCISCFMHERIDGESCCPISHIISVTQDMTDELVALVLESLQEKRESEDEE